MKKGCIILLLLIVCATVSFATPQEDKLAQSVRANFQSRGLTQIDVKVKALTPAKEIPGFTFFQVDVFDKSANQNRRQFMFSDGIYVITDVLEAKDGSSLLKDYSFAYETTDIDVKGLSLIFGDAKAKNVIVKISDFQCPYCQKTYLYLHEKIKNRKDIAVYMIHLPLKQIHPKAELLAKILEAGLAMGKNFTTDLYDANMQKKSDNEIIDMFAKKAGDAAKFKKLLTSPEIAARVNDGVKRAEALGATSTPIMYFNGRKVQGFDKALIDKALSF